MNGFERDQDRTLTDAELDRIVAAYKLKNVMISRYQVGVMTSESRRAAESFSLDFEPEKAQ